MIRQARGARMCTPLRLLFSLIVCVLWLGFPSLVAPPHGLAWAEDVPGEPGSPPPEPPPYWEDYYNNEYGDEGPPPGDPYWEDYYDDPPPADSQEDPYWEDYYQGEYPHDFYVWCMENGIPPEQWADAYWYYINGGY